MHELRVTRGSCVVRQRQFEGGPLRIGRDPEQEICVVDDGQVSRLHARLELGEQGWLVRDAGSANGTWVNGVRLESARIHRLGAGDRLSFGSETTELVFEAGPDPLSTRITVTGRGVRSAMALSSLLAESDPRALERARDRLYVLYEATRAVFSRLQDYRELLDRIKEEVVRALGVDEMIVALRSPEPGGETTYDVVNRRDRFRSTDIAGSRKLIARVLESGEAVWLDANQAEETGSTSFIRHHIRTAMCAPLLHHGAILGAIYVQNPAHGDAIFTPADFDFLNAFAAQAAIAVHAARNAQERDRLLEEVRRENLELKQGIDPRDPMAAIVGESPAIVSVRKLIAAVRDLPSTILIRGESGTGKELVAKALHFGSIRRARPYVSVSVAAFAGGVLESELFGHEKGAFSGAVARKPGRFELAHGGTLFLDEIGEIPPAVQVKFLRVLQERTFERVGGTTPIEVDVRFVFATNRDLEEAVAAGQFREDLFYRINVVPILLPPLRERPTDIPLLVESLIQRLRGKLGLDVRGVTDAGLEALVGHDYPGNVRELENILERAFIRLKIRGADRVDLADLPFEVRGHTRSSRPDDPIEIPESYEGLRRIEREMVKRALRRTGWNKRATAQLLGITHQTLYNRIAEFKLEPED